MARPVARGRVGGVEWDSIKRNLQETAAAHQGQLVDFGLLVELVPPYTGTRIRLSGLDPDSVRVEAGWFLRLTVDLERGLAPLNEVVTALILGRASEFISVRDATARDDGFFVDYGGGSTEVRPQFPDPDAVERILPAWAPVED
jgi:hypothetical protein